MRVFVAEKPSLAKAIAGGIARESGCKAQKTGGYFTVGKDCVTWCFGHLLEQDYPEEYDKKWKSWRMDTLPIIPSRWTSHPKDSRSAKQIAVIGKLLRKCQDIVNAGDPDREGQVLVDEVLEYLNNKKPVKRIWLASLDDQSVNKALSTLKDNRDYRNLSESALARSRADWLYGLNLTRAMTCVARDHGYGTGNVISVGRVQTPTLALVVRRDAEIEQFTSHPYFIPVITVETEDGTRFRARWRPTSGDVGFGSSRRPTGSVPGPDANFDSEGRLINPDKARAMVEGLMGSTMTVSAFSEKKGREKPPLPHSLSNLQSEMSSRYGLSAANSLASAQRLYTAGVTTYPRSDCRYLPEEQFAHATDLLKQLERSSIPGAEGAAAAIHGSVWNTAKITAHHAIIPTGNLQKSQDASDNQVYQSVCLGYIRQFYPDLIFLARKAMIKGGDGSVWESSGRNILDPGWSVLSKMDSSAKHGGTGSEDDDCTDAGGRATPGAVADGLPSLTNGQRVKVVDASVEEKKTTPPSRFTDGTLIKAMSSIHRFVDNPEIKSRLKETSGLGTEATRSGIIETLVGRGFLLRKKKSLISTELAREIIDLVPAVMADPGLTAVWEDVLERIASGQASSDEFISGINSQIPKLLDTTRHIKFNGRSVIACKTCNEALWRFQSKKSKKGGGGKPVYFWACSNDFSHTRFSDNKGRPGKVFK